jgi:hypothetical protein
LCFRSKRYNSVVPAPFIGNRYRKDHRN